MLSVSETSSAEDVTRDDNNEKARSHWLNEGASPRSRVQTQNVEPEKGGSEKTAKVRFFETERRCGVNKTRLLRATITTLWRQDTNVADVAASTLTSLAGNQSPSRERVTFGQYSTLRKLLPVSWTRSIQTSCAPVFAVLDTFLIIHVPFCQPGGASFSTA